MYRIRPRKNCDKNILRAFYMYADGYVPSSYKLRPSTTVPFSRLQRVMTIIHDEKFLRKFKSEKLFVNQ